MENMDEKAFKVFINSHLQKIDYMLTAICEKLNIYYCEKCKDLREFKLIMLKKTHAYVFGCSRCGTPLKLNN